MFTQVSRRSIALPESGSQATLMFSGGLDSVVLAYAMRDAGLNFDALHFRFGPKFGGQARSIAGRVAADLTFDLKPVDLSGIAQVMSDHVPEEKLAADELDVANEDAVDVFPSGMTMLPSIAAFYAQAAQRTSGVANVMIGVIKNQADRNPGLVNLVRDLPTVLSGMSGKLPKVKTFMPFVDMTKTEVIRLGADLNAPLSDTWSCVNAAASVACGTCAQCRERKESFTEAGVADRTQYVD